MKTTPNIKHLLSIQEELDAAFMKSAASIENTYHNLLLKRLVAFLVELDEVESANQSDVPEELCDALHFLLSITNLLNVTYGDVLANSPKTLQYFLGNEIITLESSTSLFQSMVNTVLKLLAWEERTFKYWKKTSKTVTYNQRILAVSILWTQFVLYAIRRGVLIDALYNAYMTKNETNYQRIKEGY